MKELETIRSYYKAYETKDRKTLERILVSNFQFISDYAKYRNRDEMLNEIWPAVLNNNNKLTDIEIFGNRNGFIVKYNLLTPDTVRMAEQIVFDGAKISKIEVFSEIKPKIGQP
ncbi:MAG: hypothetical protein NXI09_08575 [Bacteroidetes bacterium]|nr:hypothetical protein [Bacteroidota bacterium]